MHAEVIRIPSRRKEEASAVLAAAFAEDELFSRFFPGIDDRYRGRVATLFSWSCDLHAASDMPFLAAVHDGRIIGIATVQDPSRYRPPILPVREWRRVRGAYVTLKVGFRASRLMKHYSAAVAPLRPAPPFHYVSNIGVLAEARARGVRTRLLEAAFDLSRADPSSRGLVLDTFNPAFASSLESSGWSVRGPVRSGPISGFSLFRERAA